MKPQRKKSIVPPAGSPLDNVRSERPGEELPDSRAIPNPGGAQRELAREISRIEQEMIDAAFAQIATRLERLPNLGALRSALEPVFRRVTSERKLLRIMSAMDQQQTQQLGRQLATLGLDVLGGEPWVAPALQEAASETLRRIWRRVSETILPRIVEIAQKGIAEGLNTQAIARRIELEAPGSSRNPQLLARDIVGSQLGELHQRRQERLGIRAYTWRTSRDERVVGNPSGRYPGKGSPAHGDHWHREGKIYLWRREGERLIEWRDGQEIVTSYTDGHPGHAPLCRCWPQPYIPSLADLQTKEHGPEATSKKYGKK